MSRAIVCSQCGAKIRAGRERCPRCRAYVSIVKPDVAAAALAATSRRFQQVTVGILGAFVLLLGALWLVRDPAPRAVTVPASPVDPLAHRRPVKAAGPTTGGGAAAEAAVEAEGPPPFLEPSGAGTLAYASGNYESALEQYQAAVERNPQDAESLSNLGQVLVRLGRTAEAIPYFERAIQILPNRWAYQFNLARAQGLTGNWDAAIASYRRAQGLFPNDYVTTFNLALALHKKGDEAGASEEYKKAVELNPEDASFRLALATSYDRLKRPAEAAAAYQDYLGLSPTAGDADKVKARIAALTGAPAGRPAAPTGGTEGKS